ncbi:YraN family protein [Sagittula sp. S175]|uniref:YraN family protein n=1 Tax=Sagittula sp. S175 TaxID=3415129 RepID=UPI003C7A9C36
MARRGRMIDARQMSLWDWTEQPDEAVIEEWVPVTRGPQRTVRDRQAAGMVGYQAGASAELRVAQDYERRGFPIARRRWRGAGGEIDLIAEDGDGLVFIEVKKSRSFDRAAERLTTRQMARLQIAAEEYLGTQPKGSLTDVRFDLALVNGYGEMRVIENAFGGW